MGEGGRLLNDTDGYINVIQRQMYTEIARRQAEASIRGKCSLWDHVPRLYLQIRGSATASAGTPFVVMGALSESPLLCPYAISRKATISKD